MIDSELSHQPSAEFLERLEKVNKQSEAYVVDQGDTNELDHLQFALDEPVNFNNRVQDGNQADLIIQENQFSDKHADKS